MGAEQGDLSDIEALIGRFQRILDRDGLVTEGDLSPFTVDWTGRFRGTGRVVVRPNSTDQVAAIVDVCRETSTPIVPQGGNTGLVGGSVPLCGEVVLSTRRLATIGDVDTMSRQITAGAGALLGDVQRQVRVAGLKYPVDFGARDSATIGGTVATNAGGIAVLRHGMTRRHVVGIEAVLGTGEVVSHLEGLVKDNTGYDLAGLLCGSEGTLGVITAVRLQLVAEHSQRTTALVGFGTVDEAMAFVAEVSSARDDVDALELFYESGMRLVTEVFDRSAPFEAPVYVLVETSADVDRTAGLNEILSRSVGIVDVAVAVSEAMRTKLWQLREEHTPAINVAGPPLKFDVSVPVSELAHFTTSIERVVGTIAPMSQTILFGHAADGNVHVNVTGVDLESTLATEVEEAIMAEVVLFRGSVSAEHGVGTAKKRFLALSRSRAEIDAMRAVKRALDPVGIMNPNVLFG